MAEQKGKDESYLLKYAQMSQVAVSRNMMRYGADAKWKKLTAVLAFMDKQMFTSNVIKYSGLITR